jgi:antitoxin Phd
MTTVVIFFWRGDVMQEVQLKDAKASLSAIVDRAAAGEEIVITRHGRKEAVLISWDEFRRLSTIPSFGKLLMAAPIEAGDIPERDEPPHQSEEF